jgi:RNA polymerase sigma factor (sigma-70 family)
MSESSDYVELSLEQQDALVVNISFVAHQCAPVFTHRTPSKRDASLAADLAQDVVLYCLERLRAGRWSSLRRPLVLPLVIAILERRAIDLARRRHRQARRTVVYLDAVARTQPVWMSPELVLEAKELEELHRSAIRDMPPAYLEAYQMVHEERRTHEEVARYLGLSPLTVSTYVKRARRRLRDALLLYGVAVPVQKRSMTREKVSDE